jgi:bacillithiol synthase
MSDRPFTENAGAVQSYLPNASALLRDYLHDFPRVAAFYDGGPFSPATYSRLAGELRGKQWRRQELTRILRRQNEALGCGEAALQNIQKLSRPDTLAVVTGQQVGLFSGPAFTLYKALTAVRLAQSLEGRGIACVPVFWLATEDHDFEEIAGANILDDDYQLVRLREEGERPAPMSSVGYIKFAGRIAEALSLVESSLPEGEARENLLRDLRESYRPGQTWGQAFGRLMTRLFGKWGVVLLDPLDADVHGLSRAVYQRAAMRCDELRRCLIERSQSLVRAGYHAQVHVQENSTLLFHERHGNRRAVHHRDGKAGGIFFAEEGESLTAAEIEAQIEKLPLAFSPNVLLRPIVQDTLIPTIAYVAGPSELAYFGQAQVLYAAFGRPMPAIFPRAAFTLLDSRVHRILEKYNLTIEDVWGGEDKVSRKIAAAGFAAGWAERFDESERDLDRLLERMKKDVEVLDPTLLDAVKHAEEKIRYQVERVKGKITRAAMSKSDVLKRHEETLARFLVPDKELQERQVSGIYFLGRAGYGLLDRLLLEIKLDSAEHGTVLF